MEHRDDPAAQPSRHFVLLFTDVADSTRLKAEPPAGIGPRAYASAARSHDAAFRQAIAAAGGEILKDTGDGFMAVVPTASEAVRAALRFQHAASCAADAHRLAVRIGIHQGELGILDLDIHGKPKLVGRAADMAARLQTLARPGQVLLSKPAFDDARQFVRQHPDCASGQCPASDLQWKSHGHYRFKGVEEPQEVFEVGAASTAPLRPPPDGDKGWYIGTPDDEAMRGWRPAAAQAIPARENWILERRLGEGGFGEVWLARRQKTGERRVFKFCFDADRLRALRRELTIFRLLREALGDRTDIARLYEFHLDEAPYYLESEYTQLGDLADWTASRGGLAAIPLAERLEILAAVAEAASAAHGIGVIHQDIKPKNVLMFTNADGTVSPRLTDFGIGAIIDRASLAARGITAAGFTERADPRGSSAIGTRLYTPPEVIAGDHFTVRGDVYSLGVMLYQFVVGDLNRPLGVGWEHGVADELLREGIAAATMADPARRLAAAADLARWIRGLDALRAARAEAHRQQLRAAAALRQSARRRRAAFAATGVAVLASASTLLAWRMASREESLRRDAENLRNAALQSAAEADTIARFLVDRVLQAATPHEARGEVLTVGQALQRAASSISVDLAHEPRLEARVRFTVGRALCNLGDLEPGREHLRRAIALGRQLRLPPAELAEMLTEFGLSWKGVAGAPPASYDEALAALRESSQLWASLRGPASPEATRARLDVAWLEQVKAGRGHIDFLTDDAIKMATLACGCGLSPQQVRPAVEAMVESVDQLWRQGDQPAALATLDAFAVAHCPAREGILLRGRWARIWIGVAHRLRHSPHLGAAEAAYRYAVAEARRLHGDAHPFVAFASLHLGSFLVEQGRPEEAIAAVEPFHPKTPPLLTDDSVAFADAVLILARAHGGAAPAPDALALLVREQGAASFCNNATWNRVRSMRDGDPAAAAARQTIDLVLHAFPSEPAFLNTAVLARIRDQDTPAAAEAFDRLFETRGRNPDRMNLQDCAVGAMLGLEAPGGVPRERWLALFVQRAATAGPGDLRDLAAFRAQLKPTATAAATELPWSP